MKILVIQQKMIGDVLISSLICSNLRTAFPDAQIDYLVNDNTTPVLEGNPNIDNLVLFEKKHQESIIEVIKLGLQIRKQKYDIVIDAYSKLQSWIMVLLCGSKKRISYKKFGRTFLYTDNVEMAENPESKLGLAIERRISLLKPLHLKTPIDPIPKLYVSDDEKKMAQDLFTKHNVKSDRKTIMISLLGSDKSKTYPSVYMAKLVDFIEQNYNLNILFNYFPKQIDDAKTIYDLCSETTKEKIYFDLLGSDLRSFIAIMNECDIIFGNDGGAINMAKALGKPSFIIFSPYIEKKIWATFEDGKNHVSVHLSDFEPTLFENKSYADLQQESKVLYDKFVPELIQPKLKKFLDDLIN